MKEDTLKLAKEYNIPARLLDAMFYSGYPVDLNDKLRYMLISSKWSDMVYVQRLTAKTGAALVKGFLDYNSSYHEIISVLSYIPLKNKDKLLECLNTRYAEDFSKIDKIYINEIRLPTESIKIINEKEVHISTRAVYLLRDSKQEKVSTLKVLINGKSINFSNDKIEGTGLFIYS